jgi:hypothetical protein
MTQRLLLFYAGILSIATERYRVFSAFRVPAFQASIAIIPTVEAFTDVREECAANIALADLNLFINLTLQGNP